MNKHKDNAVVEAKCTYTNITTIFHTTQTTWFPADFIRTSVFKIYCSKNQKIAFNILFFKMGFLAQKLKRYSWFTVGPNEKKVWEKFNSSDIFSCIGAFFLYNLYKNVEIIRSNRIVFSRRHIRQRQRINFRADSRKQKNVYHFLNNLELAEISTRESWYE